MTADVVAAYVSNNTLPTAQLAEVINAVYQSLGAGGSGRRSGVRTGETGSPGSQVDYSGLLDLLGGRQKIEDAQTASALDIQYDARRIPRAVGVGARLSDGRPELCRAAFGLRQKDRARPRHRPASRRSQEIASAHRLFTFLVNRSGGASSARLPVGHEVIHAGPGAVY